MSQVVAVARQQSDLKPRWHQLLALASPGTALLDLNTTEVIIFVPIDFF